MAESDGSSSTTPHRPRKGALLARLEYSLYRVLSWIVRSLGEQAALRWGERLGWIASLLVARRTRLAIANVQAAFPEWSPEECREVVRRCWAHFGRSTVQFLRFSGGGIEQLLARSEIVNREIIDQAQAKGRSVVVVTPHFGAWELAGLVVASLGIPITMVARPLDNELLNREVKHARGGSNLKIVDRRGAARPLARALEQGSIIILLPDQAVRPADGILVPFLGRPAWTTSAPARLALRFNSLVLAAYCPPVEGGCRIEIARVADPLELPEAERNPELITRRINDAFSERIRQQPEMWLWMHDRWKRSEVKSEE